MDNCSTPIPGSNNAARYPVALDQCSQADDKITRKSPALLEQQPDLQASDFGLSVRLAPRSKDERASGAKACQIWNRFTAD